MHPIAYFYPEGHETHSLPGHAERPERVETIRTALQDARLWDLGPQLQPESVDDKVLSTVHTPEMIEVVKRASASGLSIDIDTYTTPASWPAALNAAGGAIATARAVWRREVATGFSLSRPPGHHATRRHAMGFCLLNNVALAAENLLQNENAKRLAIVDLDVHHGNGTQDIFYEREDVIFFSSHQVPLYPGGGQLNERGEGAGEGETVNMPLPPDSGDAAFRAYYEELVPTLLDRHQPEMLLVSLGFDSHWKDPLANLLVTARGYGEAVRSLTSWANANCHGRIALVLEGGYDLEADAACGVAAVQALLGKPIEDKLGAGRIRERDDWRQVYGVLKKIWDL
jgi:acetoin utilization deacetylase AcuC-like enzyme